MKYLGKLPARKFPDDDAENTTETAQQPVAWIDDPHRPQPHCVTDLKYCSLIDYKAGKHLLYTPLYASPDSENAKLRAENERMRAEIAELKRYATWLVKTACNMAETCLIT